MAQRKSVSVAALRVVPSMPKREGSVGHTALRRHGNDAASRDVTNKLGKEVFVSCMVRRRKDAVLRDVPI
jgi:hypothetical protein